MVKQDFKSQPQEEENGDDKVKLQKAMRRERKHLKKQKHISDNRSVFTIEEEIKKRALRIKKQREIKELIRQTVQDISNGKQRSTG